MAIRIETLATPARQQARAEAGNALAALPSGTVVAVFDSRVDAVGAAVQLAVENADDNVWIGPGAQAALKIRASRNARSFFQRLVSGLSDDEAVIRRVIVQAESDKTVLIVRPRDARVTLSRLAGARHVVEFGRWATRPLR